MDWSEKEKNDLSNTQRWIIKRSRSLLDLPFRCSFPLVSSTSSPRVQQEMSGLFVKCGILTETGYSEIKKRCTVTKSAVKPV